ncbi:hypothetical protein Y1Q_0014124 [Alligator mississippiensis]|uniref:KRAB domain-containing protein n=1 Tax=Alligator mississippiensis TaxID=8496 RepID=A0A151NR64_ALLMI|nr:hypothetical protein Y1Q_0014124 [Alligator mississippiensis]
MAAVGPAQAGASRDGRGPQLREAFELVALRFTRAEWRLLRDGDKGLYRDQMLRNYRALVSLDSSDMEDTWDLSAEEIAVDSFPRPDSSQQAGFETLSRAEQQPPEEEPANLELVSSTNQLPAQWVQRTAEPQMSPVYKEELKEQGNPRSPEGSTHSGEVSYICGPPACAHWGEAVPLRGLTKRQVRNEKRSRQGDFRCW